MLDYLFVAETFNHTFIRQTQADISIKNPKKSAYYDVLQEHICKFSLVGKGLIITVDLVDGHYEVNGRVQTAPKPPPQNAPLELIYYRQVQQRLVRGMFNSVRLEPITRYYIGWRTNYAGKEHKFELGVD